MNDLPATVEKAVQQVNIEEYLEIDRDVIDAVRDAFGKYRSIDAYRVKGFDKDGEEVELIDKELRKHDMKLVLIVVDKRTINHAPPEKDKVGKDMWDEVREYINANRVEAVSEVIPDNVVRGTIVTDVEYFRNDPEGQEVLKSFEEEQ